MTAPHGQGPPRSTLADLMRSVVAHYQAMGADRGSGPNGVELLVGNRYLKAEGLPPRIVMVRTNGTVGADPTVTRNGLYDASIAHGLTCYVWASETTDDLSRYDALDNVLDRLVSIFRKCAPGRVRISTLNPLVETNVLTYGEEAQVLVTYLRGVPRDSAVWAVPVDAQPATDPMKPNGDTGNSFVLDPTTDATRTCHG